MEDSMADSPREDLLDILEAVSRAQLRAIRRLRLSSKVKSKAGKRAEEARLSGMDMVLDILRREGRPLHITDILSAVQKRFGVELDRESVVSAISKRVARQDRFMRTAPNTFALIPEPEES
jgi:HB1/ASXL restriction endonuclease-like protein with HTH domain